MKAKLIITSILALTMAMAASNLQAQSTGTASSKEKQAILDARRDRQIELKKKYDAMSPEDQAKARQNAIDRKRAKNKSIPVKPVKPVPVVNKKTTQGKQGITPKPVEKPKPVLLDVNGKPINPKPTPPALPVNDVKPTNAVKTPVVAKPVQKPVNQQATPANTMKISSTSTPKKK